MDLEAPLDAWYVWFAVALMSVSLVGVTLSLPSEPAPDANAAANTIEEGTTSSFNTSISYEHDATEVRIDAIRIALRNDGGTDRATIAFGNMTPVLEHPTADGRQKGINITLGTDPTAEFNDSDEMREWAETVRDTADDGEWRTANDRLYVRQVHWDETSVTFVYI